jgi:hypothetical protein
MKARLAGGVGRIERRGRVEQTKRKHWVRLGAFAFVLIVLRDHFDDPGIHYYFAFVADPRANQTGLREPVRAQLETWAAKAPDSSTAASLFALERCYYVSAPGR